MIEEQRDGNREGIEEGEEEAQRGMALGYGGEHAEQLSDISAALLVQL